MKVTVCELPNNWTETDEIWRRLKDHLTATNSKLLLLPEMPFFEWITRSEKTDPSLWQAAVQSHEKWLGRLDELPVDTVIASRPVLAGGRPMNNGFIYRKGEGLVSVHDKYYLPDEPGYYEASWYERGNGSFDVVHIDGINIGFLICTELWFTARARQYLRQNIDVLVCPRATPLSKVDIWVTGGRAAAIVAGAFCLSSNYNGPNTEDEDFGGDGWIIEPERGGVMGLTSAEEPFLTLDIDVRQARTAKDSYPRYVRE